ncbi:Dipeptide transport system permease protein DppB [compost metagenome]
MIIVSIIKRLASAAVTLFGVALIVFILLRIVPGDPIAMMIAPGSDAADIALLRAKYGLDQSLPVQFGVWIEAALIGDFGTSISLKRDVLEILVERLPATLELSLTALTLALLIGGFLAVFGTLVRGKPAEAIIDATNGILLAVPDFVWALVLVLTLGVLLPVFPLSGRIDPGQTIDFLTHFYLLESFVRMHLDVFWDVAAHMTMPALALSLPLAVVINRILKEALMEAMVQDYVLLARLKGMSEIRLVTLEALRNALGPALSVTGVQFTFLVGGTVIVERIFAFPGIGNMAIDAVINRDLPLIQGLVLVFGTIFIVINLAVDLITTALNPRLHHD